MSSDLISGTESPSRTGGQGPNSNPVPSPTPPRLSLVGRSGFPENWSWKTGNNSILEGGNNLLWRCKKALYPPQPTHGLFSWSLGLASSIRAEDAWKVTHNTVSFCGELPSFSMSSALPSVWSINLYLWQQFTLTLEICKPFCPAVLSTLICSTVGRACGKQSGHPVFSNVCFTEDEHAVCSISESLCKCVLYKVMTFYSVPRIKNKNTKKAVTICRIFQQKSRGIFFLL